MLARVRVRVKAKLSFRIRTIRVSVRFQVRFHGTAIAQG